MDTQRHQDGQQFYPIKHEGEWGSDHIILLILRLKHLNFASNIAVGSNNKCNVILVVGIFEKHLFLEG
jgi:hypothetical protein